MEYLNSASIVAFPTAHRGPSVDDASFRLTETNLGRLLLGGLYKTNFVRQEGGYVVIVLGGHYFKADASVIKGKFTSDTEIWAEINPRPVSQDNQDYGEELRAVESGAIALDANGKFLGIGFTNTNPKNDNSIQVFGRETVNDAWEVPKQSQLVIGSWQVTDVDADPDSPITEKFRTKEINTDSITSSSDININTDILGIDVGTFEVDTGDASVTASDGWYFNGQAEFSHGGTHSAAMPDTTGWSEDRIIATKKDFETAHVASAASADHAASAGRLNDGTNNITAGDTLHPVYFTIQGIPSTCYWQLTTHHSYTLTGKVERKNEVGGDADTGYYAQISSSYLGNLKMQVLTNGERFIDNSFTQDMGDKFVLININFPINTSEFTGHENTWFRIDLRTIKSQLINVDETTAGLKVINAIFNISGSKTHSQLSTEVRTYVPHDFSARNSDGPYVYFYFPGGMLNTSAAELNISIYCRLGYSSIN